MMLAPCGAIAIAVCYAMWHRDYGTNGASDGT